MSELESIPPTPLTSNIVSTGTSTGTGTDGLRSAYEAAAGADKANGAAGGGGLQFPGHLNLMAPPSAHLLTRRSPVAAWPHSRLGTPASAGGPLSWSKGPAVRVHRLSAEDEAAVEAAVEIGYLLSQYSQADADLLLQTLQKEGNLNLISSTTPKGH